MLSNLPPFPANSRSSSAQEAGTNLNTLTRVSTRTNEGSCQLSNGLTCGITQILPIISTDLTREVARSELLKFVFPHSNCPINGLLTALSDLILKNFVFFPPVSHVFFQHWRLFQRLKIGCIGCGLAWPPTIPKIVSLCGFNADLSLVWP